MLRRSMTTSTQHLRRPSVDDLRKPPTPRQGKERVQRVSGPTDASCRR